MQAYHELLRSTSRTFSVGIEALPDPLRDAVTLAYLVLRVSDYYEDSPTLSRKEKRASLLHWAELLEASPELPESEGMGPLTRHLSPLDGELPDHRAAQQARFILEGLAALPSRFREPIRRHTVDTTRGMARWTERGDDFPDEAALDEYMFEVAGRVGILLTELFAAHSPRVRKRSRSLGKVAVSFGLGLQTVNVIRGLHEDPERGWTYVPRHLVSDVHRGSPSSLDLRKLTSAEQERILDFLVWKAAGHISDALRYCQLLPRWERGIRTFCIVPALLAARTALVSRGNRRVFSEPVKVERREVGRIVLRARLLFFSNGWLEWQRRRVVSSLKERLRDDDPRARVRPG